MLILKIVFKLWSSYKDKYVENSNLIYHKLLTVGDQPLLVQCSVTLIRMYLCSACFTLISLSPDTFTHTDLWPTGKNLDSIFSSQTGNMWHSKQLTKVVILLSSVSALDIWWNMSCYTNNWTPATAAWMMDWLAVMI